MALPYTLSFSPFAILTAEEMNQLVSNIEALASGTGLNNTSVPLSKIDTASFTRRQNNTTNTTVQGARTEVGWGWIQNTIGSGQMQLSETVTFGATFTTLPIVLVTYGGDAGNVAAVYGTGSGVAFGAAAVKADNITATGFRFTMTAQSAVPPAGTIYYQWMAIGN